MDTTDAPKAPHSELPKYELVHKKVVYECIPFNVEEIALRTEKGPLERPFYRLDCRDWVNILPITTDNRAILIRQYRFGTLSELLEVPGGVMDDHERDSTMAAARELEEETGYTSQRILPLASINPNPAIMTNRCHFFLALGCQINPQRKHFPDHLEDIAVELVPVDQLDSLVRTGAINHALAGFCIMLAAKYIKIGA